MGAQARMNRPLRVVLDTNVVVSALLFTSGRLAWLRAAWQAGRVRPPASRDTVEELMRVLAYPKFGLAAADRQELLADYLPYAETVRVPTKPPPSPSCRDPFDVAFLALAKAGRADVLVTGDADLLALADRFHVPIIAPEALRGQIVSTE